MKARRSVMTVVASVLCVAAFSAPASSSSQFELSRGHDRSAQACLPGIESAVRRNPVYRDLYDILASHRAELKALLGAVVDQTSYEALLTMAESVASGVDGGRVVVTLPDGTVVVDTAAEDDPLNAMPSGNSYEHFSAKTVNENHNSRVAIFAAQLYPCGIGVERKLSTSTGETESYVAIRLGGHLDSVGTARLSATSTD